MAKIYKFINNVQAMDNSLTDFYAIGVINMFSENSESIDKSIITEVMNEQVSVYEQIEEFSRDNMTEQDLDLLITNLTKELNKLTFVYLKSFIVGFTDKETGENLLSKNFQYGKK